MSELSKSYCYCTNLRRSAKAITNHYDAALKETGLSVSQYYLLCNLSRKEKLNITHWAEYVGLDRSTMVRNVKLLLAHDFIEEADGHGKTFTLSEKGTQTLKKASLLWDKAQKDMEQFLGKEDAEAILRIGSKLQELE